MPETEHSHKNNLYYTRRESEVHGPFPLRQVTNFLLLGRVRLSDEISEDHQNWLPISSRPELIPEVMTLDMSVAENREKLAAAKRWADERRLHHSHDEQEESSERRAPEQAELLAYRETREKVLAHPQRKSRGSLFLVLTLAVVIGSVWTAIQLSPEQNLLRSDCQAPAAPGVVWSNCLLNGHQVAGQDLSAAIIQNASLTSLQAEATIFRASDLRYSNLHLANLRDANLEESILIGANLREADLSGANLSGADLSFADLTDANLQQANLQGAKLDQAHWVDGTICAEGSIGRCN